MNKDDAIIDSQARAIGTFQGGTGQDAILLTFQSLLNQSMEPIKPRCSIPIGQSFAAAHFFDVFQRMKIVPLMELPAEFSGQQLADCGFSRAGYAGQNDKQSLTAEIGLRDSSYRLRLF